MAALRQGARRRSADEVAAPTKRLTSDDIWREVSKASFAYLAHVTPSGEPRVSGVGFASAGHCLFVAVDPASWKARHIEATGLVSMVVPVRRGGVLALILPLPPATITFRATAVVHPAGRIAEVGSAPEKLASMVPAERRELARVIEIHPQGEFVTYGLGVSLMDMMRPAVAMSRVPVS